MSHDRPRTSSWVRALHELDAALLSGARRNASDALATARRRQAARSEADEALRSAGAPGQAARTIVSSS